MGKGLRRSDAALALAAALVALPFVPLVLWAFAGEWRFPDLLPTAWSLRGMAHLLEPGGGVLGAALNSYYEKKAVYTYEEAVQRKAALEQELAEYANLNMKSTSAAVRGARAALDGVNRFLQRSYRVKAQARDMDSREKF